MPNSGASSAATAFLVGVTAATLVAGRDARSEVRIYNRGPQDLYIMFNGSAAVATQGYVVPNGTEYKNEWYSGPISGITAGSSWVYINDNLHG
jgi:hypothetical protein